MTNMTYTGPTSFQFELGERRFTTGCWFELLRLERDRPAETVLIFAEDPDHAKLYRKMQNFQLLSTSGIVQTPYGACFVVLWTIAADSENEIVVEHYLNFPDFFISELGRALRVQDRLKIIILDNRDGRSEGFFDHPNLYDFEASYLALRKHQKEIDFGRQLDAISYAKGNISIKTLRQNLVRNSVSVLTLSSPGSLDFSEASSNLKSLEASDDQEHNDPLDVSDDAEEGAKEILRQNRRAAAEARASTGPKEMKEPDPVYRHLDTYVQDWRNINRSPDFLNWLAEVDLFSGVTRKQLLNDAVTKKEPARVAAFFNSYKDTVESSRKLDTISSSANDHNEGGDFSHFMARFFETEADFKLDYSKDYIAHGTLYQLALGITNASDFAASCYAIEISHSMSGTSTPVRQLLIGGHHAVAAFYHLYRNCFDYSAADRALHKSLYGIED